MKKYLILSLITFTQLISANIIMENPQTKNKKALTKSLLHTVEKHKTKIAQDLIKKGALAGTSEDIPIDIVKKILEISYKPECIDIEDLSYLKIVHWGFDNTLHIGEMIVNKKLADEIIAIFTELLQAKFPIEKIRLIDEYDADDDKSMADNNSSALCCRPITGKKKFSKHSYGIAIDINPIQNPYVKKSKNIVLPPEGKKYIDRSKTQKGMILKDDPCYTAFTKRGWIWGGDWDPLTRVDYQHFEKDL